MTRKSLAIALPVLCIATHPVFAQVSIEVPQNFAGFSAQPLPTILGNLVGVIVGYLGIFLIVAIFYAGLIWMTSGGNEDKIARAKGIIAASVIGMLLILMSYSIAGFIVTSLARAV